MYFRNIVDQYFERQVNEHSNKLVLAVSCYKDSQWFLLCCEVSAYFYQTVTVKMKKSLFIDEFKKCRNKNGNWTDIKVSFREILNDLEELIQSNVQGSKEILKSKCARQIKIAIERQLSMSRFFVEDVNDNMPDERTPKTNLISYLGFSKIPSFNSVPFSTENTIAHVTNYLLPIQLHGSHVEY